MQILSIFFQLSDMRSSSAVHQHADLPALRHKPAPLTNLLPFADSE